jgi:ribonuclease III
LTEERRARLRALEQRLAHEFSDLALLDRALTHSSRANEGGSSHPRHNEPLEFLGDSVLGFIVADLLHRKDPEGDEGTKSKARAHLVSSRYLAKRAQALGIPELILLGRGEEKSGGREKESIWADAYEALVAALYLDGGLETARRFVSRDLSEGLTKTGRMGIVDHKSALQELLQARGEPLPEYVTVAEEGPSHKPRFRVRCLVSGRKLSEGEGPSKKEAQQEAARIAFRLLNPDSEAPTAG